MKHTTIFILLFISGWALFPSCSSRHKEKREEIRTMISELENAKVKIDSIDIEHFSKLYKSTSDQMKFLQKNLKNDTVGRPTALLLGNFKSSYKSLKHLVNTHNSLSQNIEYTTEQLNKLDTDLSNDLYTEEKANEFFTAEKEAVEDITTKSGKVKGWAKIATSLSNSSKPKVDSIINVMHRNGIR